MTMLMLKQLPERKGPTLIPMTSKTNSLQKKEMKKALDEDPNIFEYDHVYDDMKKSGKDPAKKDLQPKYMNSLLKSAQLRKREQDRREEKKIQKEREEEGDEFKDKEAFMTGAYKEKLKELKETEDREKREAACESILDVKKQQDLSGFYRHLLNQTVGSESVPVDSSSQRFESLSNNQEFKQIQKDKRNLRNNNRQESEDESEEEEPSSKKSPQHVMKQEEVNITCSPKNETCQSVTNEEPVQHDPVAEPVVPTQPKPNRRELILLRFQKRTIGQVLMDAVQRFQERKRNRLVST